eukprot:115156-Amorphochlora_amoeboformis.AAC.2
MSSFDHKLEQFSHRFEAGAQKAGLDPGFLKMLGQASSEPTLASPPHKSLHPGESTSVEQSEKASRGRASKRDRAPRDRNGNRVDTMSSSTATRRPSPLSAPKEMSVEERRRLEREREAKRIQEEARRQREIEEEKRELDRKFQKKQEERRRTAERNRKKAEKLQQKKEAREAEKRRREERWVSFRLFCAFVIYYSRARV